MKPNKRGVIVLNKEELIKAMAQQSGLTQKVSEEALNAFMQVVQETVKGNQKVALVGFGTFELRDRAARTCMNPRTKETMTIPAKKAATFKAGKGFQLEQVQAPALGAKAATRKPSATAKSEVAATTASKKKTAKK
jgi:DNA-binding protein HU-beta